MHMSWPDTPSQDSWEHPPPISPPHSIVYVPLCILGNLLVTSLTFTQNVTPFTSPQETRPHGIVNILKAPQKHCFQGQSPLWKGYRHNSPVYASLYILRLSINISDCLYSIISFIKRKKKEETWWGDFLPNFALIITISLNVWTLSVGIWFTL